MKRCLQSTNKFVYPCLVEAQNLDFGVLLFFFFWPFIVMDFNPNTTTCITRIPSHPHSPRHHHLDLTHRNTATSRVHSMGKGPNLKIWMHSLLVSWIIMAWGGE